MTSIWTNNTGLVMRKALLVLSSLLFLLGCSKESAVELVSFTDTGCANDVVTKAADSAYPQLILEYSEQGLVITRINAWLNCSIKEGGIVCMVSSDGNVIHYNAYERDGKTLRCTCLVEKMTSTVAGLKTGREYVLHYNCADGYCASFTFTYRKGMKLVEDNLDFWKED